MAKVKVSVEAGICGFTTFITADADGMEEVELNIESDCEQVQQVQEEINSVNAMSMLSNKKPHETEVYQVLAAHLKHVSCPVYSGCFKAVEVAAGMALPEDVKIEIEK
ncbi:DUF6951 family protein [Acetohalobium arabaticum]|uniref:Uncharacterized protein n=1 Tax=Acetohalobium arabaticum (strain ATCC 49924 / DSM 5501 / Z-7288) TaxID=574087 RepID=D9QPS8_ACEAZ|nr:hypothetical protein [Acetohalobium arabaticum]ADL12519.1 conserved hypothetical protein [Acetohalobium arabaticum DSM 5501]